MAIFFGGAALASLGYNAGLTRPVAVSFPFPLGNERGGWSGIDVATDGSRFWAVSDAGALVTGRLARERGRLVRIDLETSETLKDRTGIEAGRNRLDAEGIDYREADGQALVAFEGPQSLWQIGGPDRAAAIPLPQALRRLPWNFGLESVARDASGRIYMVREARPASSQPALPAYRLGPTDASAEATWHIAFHVAQPDAFRIVGADFGPDGALYLLERSFRGIGFATRIRRFDVEQAVSDDVLHGETLYRSWLGRHANLEGIGVWQDEHGRLRATMISDDNFKWYQRSEIVELDLPPLAKIAPGQ